MADLTPDPDIQQKSAQSEEPDEQPRKQPGEPGFLFPPGYDPKQEVTPAPSDHGSEDSETFSLTSSITAYRFENGRRYHAFREGAYWAPNDDLEKDQEAICHHMYLLTLDGKLFLAPIGDKPRKVLDVGTGTGIWAMDFADQYPQTSVIGTDLSPIQPLYVPPNLSFEVDDCCSPWLYPPNSFSFVHLRGLYGCISDYGAFYKEVYEHLEPGGWVEQSEKGILAKCDDGSIKEGSVFDYWNEVSIELAKGWGKSFFIADESRALMVAAGFVDVTETRMKWPLSPWMSSQKWRVIGAFNRLHWEQSLESWTMMLLQKIKGWTYGEIQAYYALIRKELKNPDIHAYQDLTIVYGRKPLNQPKKA